MRRDSAQGEAERIHEGFKSRRRERGLDAFEETTDYATTAPGYIAEAAGHATIVVNRRERTLQGAFIAAPGAADAIGEAVLAVKTPHAPRRPGRHDSPVSDDRPGDGQPFRPGC